MEKSSAEKYTYVQDQLFKEWKQSEKHINQVFNCDGIVNPKVWFSEELPKGKKILFVLKEAYHDIDYTTKEELTYHLCDKLKENAISSNIWKRVAEWGYGILNSTENRLAEYINLSDVEQKTVLNQIAVMNLKKSNGKPTSDKEDISRYVEEDKAKLRAQFDEINPDIIVCGNTFKWFNEIIDNEIKASRDAVHKWVYRWRGKMVFDYYHPANQFPALLNYYGIISSYYIALQNMYKNSLSAEKSSVDDINTNFNCEKIDQQMILGRSYIEANDLVGAEKCADAILSIDAKNGAGWLIKAQVSGRSNKKEKLIAAIKYYLHAIESEREFNEKMLAEIESGVKESLFALVSIAASEMMGNLPTDFDAYKRKPAFDESVFAVEKFAVLLEKEHNGVALKGILSSIPAMLFAAAARMRDVQIKRADALGTLITLCSNYDKMKKSIEAVVQIAEYAAETEMDEDKRSAYLKKLIEWMDHRIYLVTHVPSVKNGRVQYVVWLRGGNEKAEAMKKKEFYIRMLTKIDSHEAAEEK